jgi:hypothetical protein
MNKETMLHVPENVTTAEANLLKMARAQDFKHNHEVSHMLKSGANLRHLTKRSMPHVRGR